MSTAPVPVNNKRLTIKQSRGLAITRASVGKTILSVDETGVWTLDRWQRVLQLG
jgi:hypothetical protein